MTTSNDFDKDFEALKKKVSRKDKGKFRRIFL